MYKLLQKMGICLAVMLVGVSVAEAGSWDEDNAPPAGSLVGSDGSSAPIHRGFYLGLEGGGTVLNDESYTDKTTNAKATLQNNIGYNGGVTIGYDYRWLRIEEELNVANNGADKLTFSGFPDVNLDGRTTSYNAMTNVMLNIRGYTGFGVFAGVGIGGSVITYDYNPSKASGLDDTSTNKGAFSAQALAGVSYAFNRTVELDLEYRYLDAMLSDNNIPDYKANNLDLGLKFFLT